jgi:hypothetical protein
VLTIQTCRNSALTGLYIGSLNENFTAFPGYGRGGDTFIYSSADSRSLNIMQQKNTVGTDFQNGDIKFFANGDALNGGGSGECTPTLRFFADENGKNPAGIILPTEREIRFGDNSTCAAQKTGPTDATSGYYVILKAPATLEERWTLTWPKQSPASYSTTFKSNS